MDKNMTCSLIKITITGKLLWYNQEKKQKHMDGKTELIIFQ